MKQYKGVCENIETSIIGLITRNPLSIKRRNSILVTEKSSLMAIGFVGLIITEGETNFKFIPQIRVSREISNKINEGDCVLIDKDGLITVVWETQAPMNPLLLTEMCDCHCLMCPQPPRVHDKSLTDTSQRILNLVNIESNQVVCLTGGEPTLLRDDFFEFLKLLSKKHQNSSIMLLTNGKSFANFEFTKRFVSLRPRNFLTCVSLHADVDQIHDQIVGVKNSFYKTAMGLQNLARFREKIEIRIVVNRINAHRLESIALFIQRNFPFIHHCTFMGMEVTGLARDNYDTIWIDPYEYRDQLSRAVKVLSRADMNVSIYNLPLCLVEPRSWSFARKSISSWKNDYLPVCEGCNVKKDCCGIFTTSGLKQSPNIRSQQH